MPAACSESSLGSMTKYDLQALHIYPIKSCRGQIVKNLNIQADGPLGDRTWMLVDEDGKFLSQRTHPKLATLECHWDESGLTIGYNKQFFKVPAANSGKRTLPVTIWNETVEAVLEADLYSQAISQYLGAKCRLVRYTAISHRPLKSMAEGWKPEVRFADGRPLLSTNVKSLEDLNSKLSQPVGMDRFRPNIVFQGETAFEEETWQKIKIGSVIFSQPKKCSRCVMINIDQQTGVSTGADPLKTLATYRKEGNKVNFGSLWIPENTGIISAADHLEILESF